MKTAIILGLACWISSMSILSAGYQEVMDFFSGLSSEALFPVQGRGLADVESAFGPRIQTSGGNYDWHRGIDVDGALNTDLVIAPFKGYLHRYGWESTASGYTTILRHELSDFGVPSLVYEGKTITRFFTWYSHLYDDGLDGNGVGTFDQYFSSISVNATIEQGTVIGILGDSGTPANGGVYGPHLHFELRVGSNASLQFQLANPSTTQWGFDPHINPMILFNPATMAAEAWAGYEQSLQPVGLFDPESDLVFRYTINTDQLPLLNRYEVDVFDPQTQSTLKSHVLDFNRRTGFDASTTALLDTRNLNLPYVQPLSFGDASTEFRSELVVPMAWLDGYTSQGYEIRARAMDIYGNQVVSVIDTQIVPEPSTFLYLIPVMFALLKRRAGWAGSSVD